MLHPCQACRRHVKSASCPFCGAAQPASVAVPTVRGARRHRAQLLAGAAVLGAVTLAACSEETPVPVYGAPGDDDDTASSSSSGSTPKDAGEDG